MAVAPAVQNFIPRADPNRSTAVCCHTRCGLECVCERRIPLPVASANQSPILRHTPEQSVCVLAHRFYTHQGSLIHHSLQLPAASSDPVQSSSGSANPNTVVSVVSQAPDIRIRSLNLLETRFRMAKQPGCVRPDPDGAI